MDPILRDAINRRDAAAAEAARWTDFVRMYEELRGAGPTPPAPASSTGLGERQASLPQPSGGKLNETATLAATVIRELGRPIPTRALLAELTKRGLQVGGADAVATLSARLSRSSLVENRKPFGWVLSEQPAEKDDAAGQGRKSEEPAASETPNDAERRGEVAHDNMTT